jgi:two-component system chemotaxis response regulator CheB
MTHRLLIVDDSPLYRLRLSQIFSESDRLQIVGLAGNGREAIRMLTERKPDLMVLDLEMPELDGFSVLRWVMGSAPIPVVVCSGVSDRDSVFKALEAGAVDFITKPELRNAIRSAEFAEHLRLRVEAAASAQTPPTPHKDEGVRAALARSRQLRAANKGRNVRLIGIVGSAGSPAAVSHLLSLLDPKFTVPIVVALHMPKGFTKSFAERLTRATPFDVIEARAGEEIRPGKIYVSQGGEHIAIEQTADDRLVVGTEPTGELDLYSPSANRLFGSMAESCGTEGVGVVLTGMGDDGLVGAAALKRAGGYIIAESQESSVIWGMPRAVAEAGVAHAQLNLAAIAAALPLLCG